MKKIIVVGQNFDIHPEDGQDQCARTGEISAQQLLFAKAEGVILGHSEVGNTPEEVNSKLRTIIEAQRVEGAPVLNLTILVGESWSEFEANTAQEVAELMKKQCEIIFNEVPAAFLQQLNLGYEPKWGSRGSGRDDMPPPSPEFISACIAAMQTFIYEKYSGKVSPLYIYGGRSTPERTKAILEDDKINGLILGSACNTLEKTLAIAKTMQAVQGDIAKVLICNFKAYIPADSYEEYIRDLSYLPKNFHTILAPSHLDIRHVRELVVTNESR